MGTVKPLRARKNGRKTDDRDDLKIFNLRSTDPCDNYDQHGQIN